MSHGVESKESVKRRNARPDRVKQRSAQGNIYMKNHPGKIDEYRQNQINKNGGHRCEGIYAQMIDAARDPILFESNNIALTSDWHIPFHDETLVERLFNAAKEHGTKDIAIAGDFFDCDNVSKFNSISEADQESRITFDGECKEVGKVLKRILNIFDNVYICRGNHEKRWTDLNAGAVGMKQLFTLALPGVGEDGKYHDRVHITTDDNMNLIQNGQMWLLCHPRNFRITPLSVARDLSAKYLCNVFMAHGHGFNQGRDRSGKFVCLDGGGLYERAALEYTRETSCHPMTRSGFYILKEGKAIPYEGDT